MLDTRIYLFTNDSGISVLFFGENKNAVYKYVYVYHFILTPFITDQWPHTLFILTKYYVLYSTIFL